MTQAGPAPASTAFLSMEATEPLSQASCDKDPVPELQDPFYAGTTLSHSRECWGWSGGQCLGRVERPLSLILSLLSFPSFLQENVTTLFSEWVDAKTARQGVYDHVSCGTLIGRERSRSAL